MSPAPRGTLRRELVVLLDDLGRPIGTAPKATVHSAATPLHRAFSCYLFNPAGRLLLTRRAATKRTFPGVWSNSVCGHPSPGESDPAAIRRRARQELGVTVTGLEPALPQFRYRASSNGIEENEICPVYLGRVHDQPHPDPTEVAAWTWVDWPEILLRVGRETATFSPWFVLQLPLLQRTGSAERFLDRDASPTTDPNHPRKDDPACQDNPSVETDAIAHLRAVPGEA